jgi:hypothetical protein
LSVLFCFGSLGVHSNCFPEPTRFVGPTPAPPLSVLDFSGWPVAALPVAVACLAPSPTNPVRLLKDPLFLGEREEEQVAACVVTAGAMMCCVGELVPATMIG